MAARTLQAAGGVLWRERGAAVEVLLIRRRGIWDLPKGKREKGESREMCARREVAEETGLSRLPEIKSYLAETWHSYEERGEEVRKQTFWYAMTAGGEESLKPQREEGITALKWFAPREAHSHVGYGNLKEVLQAFDEWYSS